MVDGLYSVHFATPLGSGTGVIYLNDGKAYGGDASIYYAGLYQIEGDTFTAAILTDTHAPGPGSVFGRAKARINLTGSFSGDRATLEGSSPDAPGVSFQAIMSRLPV